MHTPPPPTTKQVHRRVTFVELPEANSTSDETKSVVDSSTDASSSHAGVSEVEWDHTHSHPLMGDKWLTGRVRSKEEKNTLQGYGARESTLQVMDTMAAQVEMLQGLAAGGRSSPSNLRSPYVTSCLFMFRAHGVCVWCCRFANQSVRRNENTALKNDAPLSFEHLPPPPPPPSPPLPPLPPPPHTHTHTHTHTTTRYEYMDDSQLFSPVPKGVAWENSPMGTMFAPQWDRRHSGASSPSTPLFKTDTSDGLTLPCEGLHLSALTC
jgi:hypothetical protein